MQIEVLDNIGHKTRQTYTVEGMFRVVVNYESYEWRALTIKDIIRITFEGDVLILSKKNGDVSAFSSEQWGSIYATVDT